MYGTYGTKHQYLSHYNNSLHNHLLDFLTLCSLFRSLHPYFSPFILEAELPLTLKRIKQERTAFFALRAFPIGHPSSGDPRSRVL